MQKISPMLWFDDQAEAAADHYISVFSKRPGQNRGDSKILDISRYGEAGPGPMGSVMVVRFQLEGQEFTALNGGAQPFAFSEAISFVITCENQEEVDYFWAALSRGGEEGPCGWLKDRFGLSWQVVPKELEEMLNNPDQQKAQRAMKAMLGMKKLDLPELQRAFSGEPMEPKLAARRP
ncbi:MAG: VOC family protein [Chloroflexi bacterium]|nr:MAG: VOC family protein [Chloroflexota bacterium]TME47472.1 MAG: VOC family protein [Chloroflexota bacterium]